MPKTRSRAREGTPAARAAQAVRPTPHQPPRTGSLSTWMKLGQALVFVVALGLLGLYTVSDQLASDHDFHVQVTWESLALLGVAALVVLLPRVLVARAPADDVDLDLPGRAHDAALTATAVALEPGGTDGGVVDASGSGALFAREPSPALARAARDPMTSIELSRRALASELRGLAAARFYTKPGILKAIDYFERAAEKDPRSARPWYLLALAYARSLSIQGMSLPRAQALEKARLAALRALEIDARSAEAHAALGLIAWYTHHDGRTAEAEYRQALRSNPSSADVWDGYCVLLRLKERYAEAVNAGLRAAHLNPLSPDVGWHLALAYYMRQDYDGALRQCRRVLEQYPRDGPMTRTIVNSYLAKGMCREAAQVVNGPGVDPGLWAYAQARCGQTESARAWLTKQEHDAASADPGAVALVYVTLGDKERAFTWLEQANRRHDPWRFDPGNPRWVELWKDPRYQALKRQSYEH